MTISQLFKYTKDLLKNSAIDDYIYDAVYLFEYIFGLSRNQIAVYGNKQADQNSVDLLNSCIQKRIAGMPIQYIIGEWEFMGLKYKVGKGVLIPRDDTEVLVNACRLMFNDSYPHNIADLCSGTGIIAISLKKAFCDADVVAIEKSEQAYDYLTCNCNQNNADIQCKLSDISTCCNEFENHTFDLIVSNPPYVITDEINKLQREISFEPEMALDGGKDGYDFYRIIVNNWSKKLKYGGVMAFEIGEGQFDCIFELLSNNGYDNIHGYDDLSGTVRAITAVYKSCRCDK